MFLNRQEAAKAIGKSEVTLDGYLKAGLFPNAKKVKAAGKRLAWQIPLGDLQASGLLDQVNPASASPTDELSEAKATIAGLTEKVAGLERLIENLEGTLELITSTLEQTTATLNKVIQPQIETSERQAERRRKWFARG
jgi:hypothetical protein